MSQYLLVQTVSALAEQGRSPQTTGCSYRKGSWIYHLPQLSLSPFSGSWKLCWKMWWCFISFGAVWKAEAVVELGTLLGTPSALSCNPVLTPVLQTLFLNFRPQETTGLWDGGLKIPSYVWERWWDGHILVLSFIHGMTVDSMSGWVSVRFYDVPGSFKIPWTFLLHFSLLMFLNFAALYRLLFLPLSPLAASSPPPQLLKSPLPDASPSSAALSSSAGWKQSRARWGKKKWPRTLLKFSSGWKFFADQRWHSGVSSLCFLHPFCGSFLPVPGWQGASLGLCRASAKMRVALHFQIKSTAEYPGV